MEQRLAYVDDNQKALSDAIDALVTGLRQQDEVKSIPSLPGCPSLDALTTMFGLSTFERAIVLLCTGIELDSRIASACAEASGRPESPFPTFALALATLPDPHWSALGPESPLRRWRLIDIAPAPELPISSRPLTIDERVLNFLIGIQQPSPLLQGMISF